MSKRDQHPDSLSDTDDSERGDDVPHGENRFSLTEYDLDVVDDALLNPDSTEFRDHFGFRIEVKTDDEDSSDSDSDSIDSGYNKKKNGTTQHSSAAVKTSATSSATTGSSEEDNESDGTVDTAMTTPTAHKHPNRLSASSVELQKAEVVTRNSASLTTVQRGRSATVSKVTPQSDPKSLPPMPQEQQQQLQTRRRRATTVSRPPPSAEFTKFSNVAKDQNAPFSGASPSRVAAAAPPVADHQLQYQGEGDVSLDQQHQQQNSNYYQRVGGVPMSAAPSHASSNDQFDTISLRSAGTSFETQSRPDSSSGFSLASFNLFKRAGSPTTSTRSTQRAVERPSQAFRERQSKRMSEFYRMQPQTPSSPSPSLPQASSRLSYASASSYYEMIMSKFGRTSEENQYRESPKHTALKDEAKQVLQQLKDSADGQYDWDFWYSFIHDNDVVARTQPDEVKRQFVRGVPPPLRGYIWQIVSKSRNGGELESEYRELLKRVCPYEKSIRQDLERSFNVKEFFGELNGEGHEALFNVIKAYSLFDQQIGYSQGMFYIVGCLVSQMSDEQAFAVLIRLMSQYGFRNLFSIQMETLHERLYQFDHIMQQKIPELHRHLEVQGVEPGLYATQWFMTVFAYKCSLNLVFRVLDVLFTDGPYIVLHFALALLHRNQHTLLNMEHDDLVDFLNNGIFDSYQDNESIFVQDAYNIDIPARLLTRLAKQHASEAAREAKSHSQEEHLRRINADLSKHVRRLEKSYHSLKVEHQEVTQQVIEAKMNVARMDDDNQQLRHQLMQARTELEQLKSSLPNVEELTRQNKQLLQRNNDLEDQLADIEAVLISLKVKYAERESAYEELKQKAQKAGISLL